ncbi:hypothetical protein GALMADRAFT_923601 [Galerina marginata CBS 339.88]|uniref:F-box domain-containing protein n=1 Tax=Galerina marginata (strain CBS 339.88) TaxID=685588 RepID=A0A067SGN1_GALM3|nr:hypothetical protein GALMADRAFT_923601 [Galerina marginata CBS 339.88]
MDEFPIELHIKILSYLSPPGQSVPESPEWTEHDSRSPTLFPFNVGWVCKQWLNILIERPECWKQVVFDVANDPALLLNAFLWSKDLDSLEVVVFTSSSDDGRVYRKVEKHRAFTIAQALRPHIHRCKSIIFDLTFSTSLPHANIFFCKDLPDLEELTLECHIDNVEITRNSWETTVTAPTQFGTKFTNLKKLSLTGFLFMYLALHLESAQWLDRFRFPSSAKFHISRFTFLEKGHYTLQKFAFYILNILRPLPYGDIFFRDLSLSYQYMAPSSVPNPDDFPRIFSNFYFQSVSKEFISHLFSITNLRPASLTFKDCQIPTIKPVKTNYLTLDRIIDGENGSSLLHILEAWTAGAGRKLKISSCPSFNDYHLGRMRPGDPSGRFLAHWIHYLYIHDCPNFTARVLREVVKARNDQPSINDFYRIEQAVRELCVTGKGPTLIKEDKDWFLGHSMTTKVIWKTVNKEGVHEDFTTFQGD